MFVVEKSHTSARRVSAWSERNR